MKSERYFMSGKINESLAANMDSRNVYIGSNMQQRSAVSSAEQNRLKTACDRPIVEIECKRQIKGKR